MKAQAWTLVTPALQEPISLDEVKEHLRVGGDDEDALIQGYLAAARAWAELYTGRAFVTQTWQAHFAGWPADSALELPMPPLQSVSWVQYATAAGDLLTLDASAYRVVTSREPGCVLLAPGKQWPAEALDVGLPVAVQFVCGYGNPSDVPDGVKQAIRWLTGHMHENREAVIMGTAMPQKVPFSAHWALDPYRFRYIW
jgi:uncharacterized phiE125 gp8 family phage protein